MNLSMLVRRWDGCTLVEVQGDVDINSASWLQQHLLNLLWGNGLCLLVDLSGVTFIDCFAIRLLAETCRRAERQACSIQFVALSKQVQRLAKLTGLAGELPLTEPLRRGGRSPERARDDGAHGAADPPPHRPGHGHLHRGHGMLRLRVVH